MNGTRHGIGVIVVMTLAFLAGLYFAVASLQGEYGLLRRLQLEAQAERLQDERDALREEVASLRNKVRRLSDDYLDLDLLDQQARDILGVVRADEIVVD